jgi:hypothetical protein
MEGSASREVRMYENKYPEVDDVVMVQVRPLLCAVARAQRPSAAWTRHADSDTCPIRPRRSRARSGPPRRRVGTSSGRALRRTH